MRRSTEIEVLIIESCMKTVETLSVAIQLRWPDATLRYTLEGTGGLRLARTTTPDVVVLDLDLLSMDALDVLNQLRLFSDVPIIALGESDDELRRVKALETGADDCISKPFGPLEFLASLNALLRRTGTYESRDRRVFSAGHGVVPHGQGSTWEEATATPHGGQDLLGYLVRDRIGHDSPAGGFEAHPFLLLTRDSRN